MIYFTSDTHFGHKRIIELCHRPFISIDEMDKILINNWNSKVKPNDTVYHLGDICMCGITRLENILKQLNGNIYLIRGNHDDPKVLEKLNHYFKEITFQKLITINGDDIYLNHYPFLCYGGTYKKGKPVYQLFGHVHSGPVGTGADIIRLVNLFPYQYDVGVDNNNYFPISWEEIKNKLKWQQ